MSKFFSILFIVFFINAVALAQTEKFDAPVKWERYKVSDKEVSVLLPKMPTANIGIIACAEEEINKYVVYAENVVYGFNIFSKSKQIAPDFCQDAKKFDEKSFGDRLKELKSAQFENEKETKFNQNKLEVIKITNEMFTYWLINDDENQRWFELWAANANETNVLVKNFVKSFEIGKDPLGIEIGNGSFRTLGDETSNETDEPIDAKTAISDKEIVKIKFIVKPKANYTDAARKNGVRGTVKLKVAFLASGGIGNISPLTTLPYGLTEQAIAAVAQIAFIPAKKNGVPISIVNFVEYSFSIY